MIQDIYFPLHHRYPIGMKPTVPDTGRVIKLEKDMAIVVLRSEGSCRGCGAAAIGLCKASGLTATLTVKNTEQALPGDTVTITLDKRVQRRGFLLAYAIPLTFFLLGAILGHVLGMQFALPALEIATAFLSLLAAAFLSFRELRKLDTSSMMTIKHVLSRAASCPDDTTQRFRS